MLSNKSFLIRAFYDWMVASNWNPLVLVDANFPQSHLPQEFVEDGEIVLNMAPDAIRDLVIDVKKISFQASFSGVTQFISFLPEAVLRIYAEENDEAGIYFEPEDPEPFQNINSENDIGAKPFKKSHLTVVK